MVAWKPGVVGMLSPLLAVVSWLLLLLLLLLAAVGGGHIVIIAGLVLVAVINVEVWGGVVVHCVSLPSTTLRVRVLVVSAKLGGCSPVMAVIVVIDAGCLCSIAGTYIKKFEVL